MVFRVVEFEYYRDYAVVLSLQVDYACFPEPLCWVLSVGATPSEQLDEVSSTILFYWESGKGREVDFIAKLEDAFLPIELKYRSSIQRNDVYGIIDFVKGGKAHLGIIITKDTIAQGRTHVGIPASLLLLLA